MIPMAPPEAVWRGPAVLASGHRPFFLAAAVMGGLAPLAWLAAWRGLIPLGPSWHGHEMIFGFAVAAIAGFLQAAVPKWTDSAPFRGWPVAALIALWLGGRVAMMVPAVAWIDLLFLPTLAIMVAARVIRAGDRRNYQVVAILAALFGLNVAFHSGTTSLALRVATIAIAALMALIGGRIVPLFTRNALSQAGIRPCETATPRGLDVVAVPIVGAAAATEWLWPASTVAGVVCVAAAVVLGARMVGWRTAQTFKLPIVWILHAGYAFLPIGFLLVGLDGLGVPVGSFRAMHALTAGAMGVLILAVASRAALGHSGRPLVAAPPTVVAYALVIAGAVLRVAVAHPHATIAGGILWSVGYAIFAVVYAPILTRPRVDGQQG